MKSILWLVLLASPGLAEQCEVTGMYTQSVIDSQAYLTHDYGHGVVVTSGGPSEGRRHIYTIHMGKITYDVARRGKHLNLGPADCQIKKNNLVINGTTFYIEGETQ